MIEFSFTNKECSLLMGALKYALNQLKGAPEFKFDDVLYLYIQLAVAYHISESGVKTEMNNRDTTNISTKNYLNKLYGMKCCYSDTDSEVSNESDS